jgi:MoaA/NifB/PqqE/SkfB family radical SAM enzyme
MIGERTMTRGDRCDEYSAPLFIAWQLNTECNLNCLHCCEEAGGSSPSPDAMSGAQALQVCQQFVQAGVPYVALSGGEPLLCPHIWEICEYLRSHNVDIKIETNGEMIDQGVAERLAGLSLRSVQISIDGATAKSHEALRENGDWLRVMDACRLLSKINVNMEIVFVPTNFNIHEVAQTVDLAAKLGAYGFYSGKLMRIGRAAMNWKRLCPSETQYRQFFETMTSKTEQYRGVMKVYCYPYDVIEELRYRMTSPSASLLVLPNGKVKLIGPLPFICGDLKTMSLEDIWSRYKLAWGRPEVQDFARRILNEPALTAEANNWIELY